MNSITPLRLDDIESVMPQGANSPWTVRDENGKAIGTCIVETRAITIGKTTYPLTYTSFDNDGEQTDHGGIRRKSAKSFANRGEWKSAVLDVEGTLNSRNTSKGVLWTETGSGRSGTMTHPTFN